jgi:hypothetical protein
MVKCLCESIQVSTYLILRLTVPSSPRSQQCLEFLSQRRSFNYLRLALLCFHHLPLYPSSQMAKTVLRCHYYCCVLADCNLRHAGSFYFHAVQRHHLLSLVHHDSCCPALDECICLYGCWTHGMVLSAQP